MKARIFEVFTSIEGEGLLYGTKTLFVRLAGCPFTCFYCDTPEALPAGSGKEYEIAEACRLIDSSLQPHTFKVNFTGGEPLVQHEAVAEMAAHTRRSGLRTYLESSCYDERRFAHVLPHMDILKVEFKTADSEFARDAAHYEELIRNALGCLGAAAASGKTTYIKIVVSAKTDADGLDALLSRVFDSADAGAVSGLFIQPAHGASAPGLDHLLDLHDVACGHHAGVRVVPQLQKIMGAI